MTEPKFTPGPWFITKEDWVTGGYDIAVIQDKNGEEVLGISEWIRVNEPDLRLIAAAPDMYEALKCACDQYCIGYAGDSIVKCEDCVINNALRKARGEPNL